MQCRPPAFLFEITTDALDCSLVFFFYALYRMIVRVNLHGLFRVAHAPSFVVAACTRRRRLSNAIDAQMGGAVPEIEEETIDREERARVGEKKAETRDCGTCYHCSQRNTCDVYLYVRRKSFCTSTRMRALMLCEEPYRARLYENGRRGGWIGSGGRR